MKGITYINLQGIKWISICELEFKTIINYDAKFKLNDCFLKVHIPKFFIYSIGN